MNFRVESVCVSSVGKEFLTVGVTKENERSSYVFVLSLRIRRILFSEEKRRFHLDVCTDSRLEK